MKYASGFKRFAAYLIDDCIIIAFLMVLGLILKATGLGSFIELLPMLGLWLYGGLIVFAWIYNASMESSKWQATFGKRICQLKVVDLNGKRIGFWRASIRHISKLVSRMTLLIGFLMVFFTKKKQTLHDKMAKTLIIQ